MNSGERDNSRRFKVGNIEHSTGVVIGDGSYVAINQSQSVEQKRLLALLEEFIQSLECYGDILGNSQGVVRESAVAVRGEVATPAPKWQVIRRMLAAIAGSVAGIAALTDAISNIQTIVTHLID